MRYILCTGKYTYIDILYIQCACVCVCICLEERRVEVPVRTPTANHISSGNDVTVNADK